ncbi:MAG: NAD(P)H-binding protein, partial [Nostocoides sp.]
MRILVAGATGYVGSRLVPVLLAAGHEVRVGVRRADLAARMPWAGGAEVVPLEVRERSQARAALAGMDALCYLVHGLAGDDFAGEDRIAAETMATEAVGADLSRIVYLSGLVPDVGAADLSPHIASRLEVEQILTASGIATLSVRAGMILGGGSTSFEVLRQVSERFVLQPVPSWLGSRVQPIAVTDVLLALAGALRTSGVAPTSRSYDVGGPDVLTYPALLRLYAASARLWRFQVRVPLVPSRVVGVAGGW